MTFNVLLGSLALSNIQKCFVLGLRQTATASEDDEDKKSMTFNEFMRAHFVDDRSGLIVIGAIISFFILIGVCFRVQHRHQKAFLERMLPKAQENLMKSIIS
jgi:hypothetical protein